MKTTPITIGAFEAKIHLAELLRKVGGGQVVRITRYGKPVAELIPMRSGSLDITKAAAQKMLVLMRGAQVQSDIHIKSLISTGRD